MITPLYDANLNGKENVHLPSAPSKTSKAGLVGSGKPPVEKRKRSATKGKDDFVEVVGMNQAFDKLLVRSFCSSYSSTYLHLTLGRSSNSLECAPEINRNGFDCESCDA